MCCLLYSGILRGQDTTGLVQKKDVIDVFVHWLHIRLPDSTRKKNAIIFSIIPVVPANLGQKQAAFSAINVAFFAGNPGTTNLSSIYFLPYTNFSSRSGFTITPNVWLADNRWNLNGDIRITKNENITYGLGSNTPTSGKNVIDYRYVRIYLNASRKIWGPFYVGIGYAMDHYSDVKNERTSASPDVFSTYGVGTGPETKTAGFTVNLLFDSRKNSINPSGGAYSSLTFRFNPAHGDSALRWSSVYFDTRKYLSLSEKRHSILAFWMLYWGTYGEVPYLVLPGTSLDASGRMARGYDYGRYRGMQMLYGETEWRFDLTANGLLGGVVFLNTQSYSEPATEEFSYLQPAVGTGLRLKFNKRSNMNITLDFAVGKNSFNWYLNLGEFF